MSQYHVVPKSEFIKENHLWSYHKNTSILGVLKSAPIMRVLTTFELSTNIGSFDILILEFWHPHQ